MIFGFEIFTYRKFDEETKQSASVSCCLRYYIIIAIEIVITNVIIYISQNANAVRGKEGRQTNNYRIVITNITKYKCSQRRGGMPKPAARFSKC